MCPLSFELSFFPFLATKAQTSDNLSSIIKNKLSITHQEGLSHHTNSSSYNCWGFIPLKAHQISLDLTTSFSPTRQDGPAILSTNHPLFHPPHQQGLRAHRYIRLVGQLLPSRKGVYTPQTRRGRHTRPARGTKR